MRDYSQIVTKVVNTPWLILPDSLTVILGILDRHIAGEKLNKTEIRNLIEVQEERPSGTFVSGGVGIIPLQGPIFPKANMMTEMSGATSLGQFRKELSGLVNNPNVKSIVLDIDSPGGMTDLVMETGHDIYAARAVKPIYAVANTLAASAAYWLASQATQVFVTPSGMVGSIGVYTVHEDYSRREANAGIKTTLIHSGKYKTEGNPYEPLSEEAREYRQRTVDRVHSEFIEAVARGRNFDPMLVREKFGQGRLLMPSDALEVGMVDGIESLEAVVGSALVAHSTPTPYVAAFNNGTTLPNIVGATSSNTTSSNTAISTDNANSLNVFGQEEYDHVEQEHAEPGTGSPPEPRRQEPDRGGTENKDRLESPPEVLPRPITGMEANVDEFLIALATSMDLDTESCTDDAQIRDLIMQRVSTYEAELAPLREASNEAERVNTFRDQFPEEYERMVRLEERDRAHSAAQFAARYERFSIKDETGAINTVPRGFSALVLSKIEDAHIKISERTFTHDDLASLLDSIPQGVVEFGERGSSRSYEDSGSTSSIPLTPGAEFASKVKEVMENDQLSYADAVRVAAKNHPDLYTEYRNSVPLVTNAGGRDR